LASGSPALVASKHFHRFGFIAMKLKTLIISVAVLAALSVVAFVARRPAPPPSADARLDQPLADRSTVEKAAKLRITDQGKTVALARQADGTWHVTSYYDLPADFTKLSGFIANLTDAKLERLVTSNPEKINRLEFKDTKIELMDANDKELWSVTLGKSPELGSGRYVRFGSEQKAYLATLTAWLDTESKNWANTELLTLKADDIAKVEIPFSEGGPIVVSRAKKDDPWTSDKTPANQKVKADRISSLLSSVGSLRFSDTTNPDDPNAVAAKANQRTVKLTTFDNKTITVSLGRKPEEKKAKPAASASAAKTDAATKSADEKKPEENKPAEPEFETVPAGPVFVTISNSDSSAPINALMQKRAFQVADYIFTGLPQKPEEIFEAAPPPAPPTPTPADEKKPATK